MRFEVIGVQFDQPGHDQFAAGVLAACRRITLADLGNASIRKGDPAALNHAIRQNDPRVAEHGLALCRSHLKVFPMPLRRTIHVDNPL